jgi:hypothetical protein
MQGEKKGETKTKGGRKEGERAGGQETDRLLSTRLFKSSNSFSTKVQSLILRAFWILPT